jgi:hypothetical protein
LRLVIFRKTIKGRKENLYLYHWQVLLHFTKNDIVVNRIDDYLNIPQNKVNFMILSIKRSPHFLKVLKKTNLYHGTGKKLIENIIVLMLTLLKWRVRALFSSL